MERLRKFRSIKKRVLGISALFTAAVTVLITTYSYFSYQKILYDSLKQSTEYSLRLLFETLQYDLEDALSLTDFCAYDHSIASYLSSANRREDNTMALANQAWEQLKKQFANNSHSIYFNRVIVSDNHNHYIQFSPYNVYQNISCSRLIESQPYFQELFESEGRVKTGFVPDPVTPFEPDNLVLPIVRPVYAAYRAEALGWCYLAVSPNLFLNRLKDYSLSPDSCLYLTLGNTTYRWNQEERQLEAEEYPENPGVTAVACASEKRGWSLTQTISREALSKQTWVYMSTFIVIIGIVLFLSAVMSMYLHCWINIPLKSLQKKLKSVASGDFSRTPEIEWNSELGEIGAGINNMCSDISRLIQSRLTDQEKKYELEYEILQNQVNPHFLYNTLNSIIWMASAQGAKGILEMAAALSQLLKSVSKKSSPDHTIGEELELLNHYFLIQKYRYGGGLSMNCQVEDETLYSAMILKFIFQIIVENAIFHGIEPSGARGLIELEIRYINDQKDISVSVTDNGVGMTQEEIRQVMESAPSSSDLFRKIGIHNIQKRIQYAYGPSYGISIRSVPGQFTTVVVTIPHVSKEEPDCV